MANIGKITVTEKAMSDSPNQTAYLVDFIGVGRGGGGGGGGGAGHPPII